METTMKDKLLMVIVLITIFIINRIHQACVRVREVIAIVAKIYIGITNAILMCK